MPSLSGHISDRPSSPAKGRPSSPSPRALCIASKAAAAASNAPSSSSRGNSGLAESSASTRAAS